MTDHNTPADSVDVTATRAPTTRALDDLMSSMEGLASFIRGLLDDAASIIQTAREEREEGLDVGVALNHAQMLLSQIEETYPHLNDLAEGVTALHEGRARRWRYSYGCVPISKSIYPDLQDRLDQLASKLAEVRAMDAGSPGSGSPEAYRRLIRYHDIGHLHVLGLANEDTAPPSLAAAKILHIHYNMMCTIRNNRAYYLGDRWAMQTIVDWINWTGWSFHNMAEMATGKHDRWHPEFFVAECRSFVEWARTKPVPAAWHPDNSHSHDHPGPRWKELCEFVARHAGMDPAYGVPMEPTYVSHDMPDYPEPPKPILGLHTARSVRSHWQDVARWCRQWASAQRTMMSIWQPDAPKNDSPRNDADQPA